MASRIAARSATTGTPVKSCMRIRAGENAIWARCAPAALVPEVAHDASASMLSAVTLRPSSWRSRFSSRIFRENGRRPMSKRASRGDDVEPVDRDGAAAQVQAPPGTEAVALMLP